MHIRTSAYQKIFLIGFMGCGKTHWGKKWGELSGLDFYDVDDMVEAMQGKSAAEIFAEDGEDYFRERETLALKSLSTKSNFIAACGGGTPCFNDNITWMNEHGTCIYLQSSPQNIYNRLVNEKETRPLVKGLQGDELLFFITQKIRERESFYNLSEIIIDVDDLPANYLPEFLKI